MSRKTHMCLNVRGFLTNSTFPRDFKIFQRDDGTPMTPEEARESLYDEIAKGHEVIPMSPRCDNFDFKTGCRGHEE